MPGLEELELYIFSFRLIIWVVIFRDFFPGGLGYQPVLKANKDSRLIVWKGGSSL